MGGKPAGPSNGKKKRKKRVLIGIEFPGKKKKKGPTLYDLDESLVRLVHMLIGELNERDAHTVEGIFRIKGGNDAVEGLHMKLEKYHKAWDKEAERKALNRIRSAPSAEVLSTCLKRFVSNLRVPLITPEFLDERASLLVGSETTKFEAARAWPRSLRGNRQEVGLALLDYLYRVAANAEKNLMSPFNLNITPNLYGAGMPSSVVEFALTYWDVVRRRPEQFLELSHCWLNGQRGTILLGRSPDVALKLVFLGASDAKPMLYLTTGATQNPANVRKFDVSADFAGHIVDIPLEFQHKGSAILFAAEFERAVALVQRQVPCISVVARGSYEGYLQKEVRYYTGVHPNQWEDTVVTLGDAASGNEIRCYVAETLGVPHRAGVVVEAIPSTTATFICGADRRQIPADAASQVAAENLSQLVTDGVVAMVVLHNTSRGDVEFRVRSAEGPRLWSWAEGAIPAARALASRYDPSPDHPTSHRLIPLRPLDAPADGEDESVCLCGAACLSPLYTCMHCHRSCHPDCYFTARDCTGRMSFLEIPMRYFSHFLSSRGVLYYECFAEQIEYTGVGEGWESGGAILGEEKGKAEAKGTGVPSYIPSTDGFIMSVRPDGVDAIPSTGVLEANREKNFEVDVGVVECPAAVVDEASFLAHRDYFRGEQCDRREGTLSRKLEDVAWTLTYQVDSSSVEFFFDATRVVFVAGSCRYALVHHARKNVFILVYFFKEDKRQAKLFQLLCRNKRTYGVYEKKEDVNPVDNDRRAQMATRILLEQKAADEPLFGRAVVVGSEKRTVEAIIGRLTKSARAPWVDCFLFTQITSDRENNRLTLHHRGVVSFAMDGPYARLGFQLTLEFKRLSGTKIRCFADLKMVRPDGKVKLPAPRGYNRSTLRLFEIIPDNLAGAVVDIDSFMEPEYVPFYYAPQKKSS